ncbi:hypothetical protein RclHR1_18600001 [Rhizophagus clarus]|uniref:Uncharacterized protein n=1 Tax=Rhizophagus clarus TaxID=94130 RepID=A0A2Z6QRX8_9GLOM|nr:hypothetical protein RclHR1_18600001 [Rhizophagus clarus]
MSVWTHPFIWTPAANAWKEGIACLLGPITIYIVILLDRFMNISSGISSFFHDSNIENWSLIGCLDHLVKMGVNLTSEDREEFIEEYKAQLLSLSSRQSMLQKARNKARKLAGKAERTFQREKIVSFFKKLDTLSVTSATLDLANATDDLANAKGNLFETKLKVDAYNKIIREPLSTDENQTRKRKHSNGLETPPRRSLNNDSLFETPPRRSPNNNALLDTPNKRQKSDKKVIQYLNAMAQSLEYVQVTVQRPSLWTEPLNSYIDNVLKKSDDEFKTEILRKIKGD